ncbi:MAG: polysaccharide biosynthesis tyrosine autokinase, partial [Chlorobium sp.]
MNENLNPVEQQNDYRQLGERDISVQEILKIIFRRKYGILLILLLSLTAALINFYATTPEYHAVSVIMINDPSGTGDVLQKALGVESGSGNTAVKKDVELLKSMPISELTVRELYKSNRKDGLEFFGKRTYLSPVARFFQPFELSHQPQVPNDGSEQALRYYALKFNKRINVEAARETNVLKVSVASPFSDEAAFLSNALCRVYKEADIARNSEKYSQASRFIIEMLDEQKKNVAETDNLLSKYMAEHEIYELSGNAQMLLDKLIQTDSRYRDILAEYNITKNSLDFLEKKLTAEDKALSARIAQNVNSQLGAIMDEIRSSESEYMRVLREKGVNAEETLEKKRQLAVVKSRYEQLSRSKIAGEIGYAGRAQKFNFDMVSEKLQIERKLNDLNFSSSEFSRLKQFYESQLSTLPKKQQEYAKLFRDREVVNKTYIFLKEKLDETRILLGSEVGSVSLIGSAFRPFLPEKPERNKNILMGLVIGLLLAALYTYAAESLDDTVFDETFFREVGLPLLSVIPVVTQNGKSAFSGEHFLQKLKRFYNAKSKALREKALTDAEKGKAKQIPAKTPEVPMPRITDGLSSPFAESFRTLRTSLDYSRIDGQLKSLLVSGTAMSEGKSTVCANLGMAYALTGKKTLIIDCDLRRASQHKKFNCKKNNGLTDYLYSHQHTIDKSFFQPTHLDRLFLLSAGKKVPNPNELLGSAKMLALLKQLDSEFDMIVLDSPPLFLSDAAQLSRSVDGTLIVARLKYSSRKPLQEYANDPFLRPHTLGVVA